MRSRRSHHLGGTITVLCLLAALGPGAASAGAVAPTVGALWASEVAARTVRLHAEVNPNGKVSSYHLDYIAKAGHDANLGAGKDGFAGSSRVPASGETTIAGTSPTTVSRVVAGLEPGTAYRYRFVVGNPDGSTISAADVFATHSLTGPLPDNRGWELVSPVDKNGGQIFAPGTLLGGGVLQAAADGQSVTYGSAASFGIGAQGSPPASQYVSRRGAGGWSTENVTVPIFAGSYGAGDEGVPYQLFSPDLARGLLLNGRGCRGEATGCPVANPPLSGTDAPAGYQNYYLRESAGPAFEALLGTADVAELEVDPAAFEAAFAGASPDLKHVVLSTCAALTPDATEVPLGPGCDPAEANLYLWSGGVLDLINVLPAQVSGTPGAALAAQGAAVSADGSRVYWTDTATGNLYLSAGAQTRQVDNAAGGGGSFQTATPDGSVALFTKAGHLWRYDAVADSGLDLTPSGGVLGVLGASANASHVYYLSASGLFLRQGAVTTKIADAADASNYPPTTGTSRVSADGTKLLFVSSASLTGFDNTDLNSGNPDSQVYLYDTAGALTCVSCNPTNARPLGPSTIPGAVANGTVPGSTQTYKPRALAAGGRRVFFESSDALALADVNFDHFLGIGVTDLYQWEAQGTGSCAAPGGCVSLMSSGTSEEDVAFVDASADGSDVFFLTERSLVGADSGSRDLYDARVGGGFPEPPEQFPCNGDTCQIVPAPPQDPTLTTVLAGPGNPPERYRNYQRRKAKSCRVAKKRPGARCASKGKRGKRHGAGRPSAQKRGGRG